MKSKIRKLKKFIFIILGSLVGTTAPYFWLVGVIFLLISIFSPDSLFSDTSSNPVVIEHESYCECKTEDDYSSEVTEECTSEKISDESEEVELNIGDQYNINVDENNFLVVYELSDVNREELGRIKLDTQIYQSVWAPQGETLVLFEDKYLVFLVDVYPTGCVEAEYILKEDFEACVEGISLLLNEYARAGGIWKFNLESQAFTHLVKVPRKENDSVYDISSFSKVERTNYLYFSFNYNDPDGNDIEEKYLLDVVTEKTQSLDI